MPLAAELISGPEGPVEVGRGTVVYVEGTCERAAEDLEIELAGARASVTAAGMSAPGRLGSGDRWWGLLELPAGTSSGESELVLDARLNGGRARARLASLRAGPEPGTSSPLNRTGHLGGPADRDLHGHL
jgi:hypothetical protein